MVQLGISYPSLVKCIMSIETSGLYYPNKIVNIYVSTIEETIGPESMAKLFELAGIPAKHYPPPNNYAKEFDFAYFSAIGAELEKLYGARGERGLTWYAGKACFASGLAEFGSILGIGDLAFKAIPLSAKLKVGLKGIAETFSKFSDQKTDVSEADDHFIYTIYQCPVCWNRSATHPICYVAGGIIEEGLSWVSGGKTFLVEQATCRAMGDPHCVFHIAKEPLTG